MRTGAAVTVAAAGSVSVPSVIAPGWKGNGCKLDNASRFALNITAGASQLWCPPWNSIVLPGTSLGTGYSVTVVDVGGIGSGVLLPTYYEQADAPPPVGSLSATQQQAIPQLVLPPSPHTTPGNTTDSFTVSVPSGALAMGLIAQATVGTYKATVTGVTSGFQYYQGQPATGSTPTVFFVWSAVDAQVTVQVQNTAGGSIVTTVVALFDPALVTVITTTATPLSITGDAFIAGVKAGNVPVETSVLSSVQVGATLAPGATATLIAAIINKLITVFDWDWNFSPQALTGGNYVVTLEDTGGANPFSTSQVNLINSTAVGIETIQSPRAVRSSSIGITPSISGSGLRIHAAAANPGSVFVSGTLTFTQQ